MQKEAEEILKLVYDKIGISDLKCCVLSECYETEELEAAFKEIGVEFKFVNGERDYSHYYWRFKLNDFTFEVDGYYCSYDGRSMYDFEPKQVEKVTEMVETTYYKVIE